MNPVTRSKTVLVPLSPRLKNAHCGDRRCSRNKTCGKSDRKCVRETRRQMRTATPNWQRGIRTLCAALISRRGKTFQRPVDGLGVTKVVALGEPAADVAAGPGFVLAVDADRDQLHLQLLRRFDDGLDLLLPLRALIDAAGQGRGKLQIIG